jgi:hypothetical protein
MHIVSTHDVIQRENFDREHALWSTTRLNARREDIQDKLAAMTWQAGSNHHNTLLIEVASIRATLDSRRTL